MVILTNLTCPDFSSFLNRRGFLNIALLPLSAVFAAAVFIRRQAYKKGILNTTNCGAPVIVVGNIVAGGSGKTPVVIALAKALQARGKSPGIVSRGYGGNANGVLTVTADTDWRHCGDEAKLIHHSTGAPVCVARARVVAARELVKQGCDIIISDDGLQHYAMRRDIEICVINRTHQFGNGWFLPAGPLRESRQRAEECDIRLLTGGDSSPGGANPSAGDNSPDNAAAIENAGFYALNDPTRPLSPDFFHGKRVAAVAAIAHPHSFFDALEAAGISISTRLPLPDHAVLPADQLAQLPADAVLMTEKDAVKYADENNKLYVSAIRCVLPDGFVDDILTRLSNKETTA